MPPCQVILRSLLVGSRSPARLSIAPWILRSQWRPAPRSHGTAVAGTSRNVGNDASAVKSLGSESDAAYLELVNKLQDDVDTPKEEAASHAMARIASKRSANDPKRRRRHPEAVQNESMPTGGPVEAVERAAKTRLMRWRLNGRASPAPSDPNPPRTPRYRDREYWHGEYRKLDARYNPMNPGQYLQDPGPPQTPRVAQWLTTAIRVMIRRQRESYDGSTAVAPARKERDFWKLWSFIWQNTSRASWTHIVVWFLYHEPELAIELMTVNAVKQYLPSRCIRMGIQYLVAHFHHCQDEDHKVQNLTRLAEVVLQLADQNFECQLEFEHRSTLQRLLPYWSRDQLNAMWIAIREQRIMTSWATLLHFARRMIDNGEFGKGLDAILEAKNTNADVDSEAFRSSCAHLLRMASKQPSGLRVTLRLVDNLVAMGMTLNVQMCNIVILNAIEAGDLNTAFTLYRSLVQNGLEADSYTYGILLKGCRGIDDADMLNETIRSAITHVNVQQDEQLATEILHCLALFHTKKDPENAFKIIAEAYSQLFDSYPLRMLGVLTRQSDPGRRMPSTKQAIGIMLSAYVEDVNLRTQTFHETRKVYDRYRELVVAGVEPFASMISSDYLPNIFLGSFIRTESGLLSASQVIKDMQRPSDDSRPIKQCLPTLQTWTIYLNGFARHRKMELAEQVLTYMRNKGLEPDVVTWNVLIRGYAIKQDEEGLLGTIGRLEDAGHSWTQATVDNMAWYRKQESLGEVLRQREQKAISPEFVGDLKRQLMQRFEIAGKETEEVKAREKEDAWGNMSYRPFE